LAEHNIFRLAKLDFGRNCLVSIDERLLNERPIKGLELIRFDPTCWHERNCFDAPHSWKQTAALVNNRFCLEMSSVDVLREDLNKSREYAQSLNVSLNRALHLYEAAERYLVLKASTNRCLDN
jgi:hypothetical protein